VKTPSLVVRYVARRAVPFIQLYALYVLGHGEDGPGGGFQGGVIFASSFLLLALALGYTRGRSEAPDGLMQTLAAGGALLYAGIGLLCVLFGGMFLEYEAFVGGAEASHHAKHQAHHFALIGIELGVMLTVTASMVVLFFEMARPADFEPPEVEEAEPADAGTEARADG
jgi:multicomponent Na+:H+ antiporter subunit B